MTGLIKGWLGEKLTTFALWHVLSPEIQMSNPMELQKLDGPRQPFWGSTKPVKSEENTPV